MCNMLLHCYEDSGLPAGTVRASSLADAFSSRVIFRTNVTLLLPPPPVVAFTSPHPHALFSLPPPPPPGVASHCPHTNVIFYLPNHVCVAVAGARVEAEAHGRHHPHHLLRNHPPGRGGAPGRRL